MNVEEPAFDILGHLRGDKASAIHSRHISSASKLKLDGWLTMVSDRPQATHSRPKREGRAPLERGPLFTKLIGV
ncbi:MAG: hypothetical protein AUK47_20850 [Deltaproteobacteria bacterium CG2_30_63_29]|nr:MAG: hypothetical protein AUK47_20850 [Deltaproteobacteria bacterium CG2_30_63_29]PJB49306.1 MAG: hypothetical protein CO108_00295 [Deltaproteobacteria bacterium CG_4_9_14_3_um_filter_63_12]